MAPGYQALSEVLSHYCAATFAASLNQTTNGELSSFLDTDQRVVNGNSLLCTLGPLLPLHTAKFRSVKQNAAYRDRIGQLAPN